MGTIHRPSDSGSAGTDITTFIQCINSREPQINKLWFLGFDRIFPEVHPTAHIEIPAGILGEFVTDYISENGRWIAIIVQLFVNDSVQFLVLSEQAWGSGFPYIANLLDQVDTTVWDSSNNYNYNWEYVSTMPIAIPMFAGVLPLTPIILTFQGVLNDHAPPDAVSATISFVTVVRIACGVNLLPQSLGRSLISSEGGKQGWFGNSTIFVQIFCC